MPLITACDVKFDTKEKKGKEKQRQNHLQVMGKEVITYFWQVQLGLKEPAYCICAHFG